MTNPMSILLYALKAATNREAVGLCELPEVTLERAGRCLGIDRSEIDADYLGVNHQGFFLSLSHRGNECLSQVIEAWNDDVIDRSTLRDIGALPLSYMRLYYHREREVRRMTARSVSRGRELEELADHLLKSYDAKLDASTDLLERRSMPWFEKALAPAIEAAVGGPSVPLFVSTINRGFESRLPSDAVVEVLARIRKAHPPCGLEPVPTDQAKARPELVAFLERVIRFEKSAAEAALDPTERHIRQALNEHPFELSSADIERLIAPLQAVTSGAPR